MVALAGLMIANILRNGVYSGRMGINVAVIGETGTSLLLLRPEEGLVSWVDLPADMTVKIYNSSASYPVESLWQYSMGEKKPFETVEKSLGQTLGIVLTRTVKMEKGGRIEDVLGQLLDLGLKTDLSVRDRFLIRQFLIDTVNSKKVLTLSLPESVFDETTDPDGKEFLNVNNEIMSLWTKNKFALEPILDESADIAINNISSVEGEGLTLSRQLESAGMRVVEVKADTTATVGGTGCLYEAAKPFTMTEDFLRNQVGCKKIDSNLKTDSVGSIQIWLK